ncbi:MAG: hypothetical protein LBN39_06460, partial [Planctomycetaceae bacterium]|nr:hypothetical protein [Planctomycetaceae bacterium]
ELRALLKPIDPEALTRSWVPPVLAAPKEPAKPEKPVRPAEPPVKSPFNHPADTDFDKESDEAGEVFVEEAAIEKVVIEPKPAAEKDSKPPVKKTAPKQSPKPVSKVQPQQKQTVKQPLPNPAPKQPAKKTPLRELRSKKPK